MRVVLEPRFPNANRVAVDELKWMLIAVRLIRAGAFVYYAAPFMSDVCADEAEGDPVAYLRWHKQFKFVQHGTCSGDDMPDSPSVSPQIRNLIRPDAVITEYPAFLPAWEKLFPGICGVSLLDRIPSNADGSMRGLLPFFEGSKVLTTSTYAHNAVAQMAMEWLSRSACTSLFSRMSRVGYMKLHPDLNDLGFGPSHLRARGALPRIEAVGDQDSMPGKGRLYGSYIHRIFPGRGMPWGQFCARVINADAVVLTGCGTFEVDIAAECASRGIIMAAPEGSPAILEFPEHITGYTKTLSKGLETVYARLVARSNQRGANLCHPSKIGSFADIAEVLKRSVEANESEQLKLGNPALIVSNTVKSRAISGALDGMSLVEISGYLDSEFGDGFCHTIGGRVLHRSLLAGGLTDLYSGENPIYHRVTK